MPNTRGMYRTRVVKVLKDRERILLNVTGNKDEMFSTYYQLMNAWIAGKPTYIYISKWSKNGFNLVSKKEL